MQLEKIFRSFGFSVSSAELVTVFLVMLAISVAFWLLVGRKRLHGVLVNIYLAFILTQTLPKDLIGANTNYLILIFLGVILLLTFMSAYTFDIQLSGSGLVYWQLFVMSFLEVGLIVSSLAYFVGDKLLLKYVSRDSLFYFTSPWARFIWLLAPLAFLIYINKKGR